MEMELRNLTPSQLRGEIRRALDGLVNDEDVRAQARNAEIDLDAVEKLLGTQSSDELVSVESRPTTRGLPMSEAATAVVIAFAPVAAKILQDIWDHVILPRIRRDHGQNAITPKDA